MSEGSQVSLRLGPNPMFVAVVAGLLAVIVVALVLAGNDWDITIFAAFGSDSPETLEFGERLLGEVRARNGFGHDGKFSFLQANDPFLLDPENHSALFDRPQYRAQRMLYPMFAGGFGLFEPQFVIWSMVGLNVLGLAVGSFATALVARAMGGSSWWGLAFALNIGMLSELFVSGAGVVGAALTMLSVAAVQRSRLALGLIATVASVLSREVLLITAVGIAWWLWKGGRRRQAAWFMTAPLAAASFWAIYVRVRLGWGEPAAGVEEFGWPLVGLMQAFDAWTKQPLNLMMGLAVIALFVLFVRHVLAEDWLVGWAAIGFIPLALLFTRQVWLNYFDISRAVAPVITAFVLVAFAARTSDHGETMEPTL